ncbi:ABC transporter permease subunit [Aquiluna borgnonia]|uniref:Maltose/maltodextrin transport system permease protein n=1 Tax=Aquiluna borgnonia TaxID=2499157 RepID=A0A7D4Q4Q5_9MICO|nr:ABC transporter permease subunit [Aquiluna borgnonia]QKJ25749.1 ABC transporter permease subunit [Aquiluna borgnonia]
MSSLTQPNLRVRLLPIVLKILILSLIASILGYMTYVAFLAGETVIGSVLALVMLGSFVVYGSRKMIPLKFLFPGIVLLAVFVVTPILYTVLMSGFVYKTGNEITREEALLQIYETGYVPDENFTAYYMTLGKYEGEYAALLTDASTGVNYLGANGLATVLEDGQVELDEYGSAVGLEGFTPVSFEEAAADEASIIDLRFAFDDGSFIRPESLDAASLTVQAFKFDVATGKLVDSVNGITYVDNGNGNFVNEADPQSKLYPGWRAFNPLENYVSLLTDPVIRGPFINVFIWTFSFALISVTTMFAAGLALAIALDKKIPLRNFYKSILILPYAIPSFMSILIWNGMFNRDFGAVNQLIGVNIDWYNDALLAKLVIIIVNLWLGFPYFYLISSGALQALPGELEEAAAIDGASPTQIMARIKLPLLLQILSPLLIASFAFNFNNFNIVYLLTNGGPVDVLKGETAGATDILITYAYKTAFGSAEQNLGLASAISVIMFLIVGALSLWSLRRSKVLESVM